MCECLLGALVEVKYAPAGARAVGPATAASPARCVGVGIVAVVSGRHVVAFVGVVSSRVEFLSI